MAQFSLGDVLMRSSKCANPVPAAGSQGRTVRGGMTHYAVSMGHGATLRSPRDGGQRAAVSEVDRDQLFLRPLPPEDLAAAEGHITVGGAVETVLAEVVLFV